MTHTDFTHMRNFGELPMMHTFAVPHFIENGIQYRWDVGHCLTSLYGAPVLPASLIPTGRVLTITNTAKQSLIIRGETHDDKIRFIHLCGEGGDLSLGAWVPLAVQPLEARFPIEFLKGLGWQGVAK